MASLLDDLLKAEIDRLMGALNGRAITSESGPPEQVSGVRLKITRVGRHMDVQIDAITGTLFSQRRKRCVAMSVTMSGAIWGALTRAASLPPAYADADLARTLGLEADGSFARPTAEEPAIAAE